MQVTDSQTTTNATTESILNRFIEWSKEVKDIDVVDQELLGLANWYLQNKHNGGCIRPSLSLYDLKVKADSGNHVSNIYAILKDGIPRTTASWRNPSTGIKEESALERELYQRFRCSPNARAILARVSNIRKDTVTTPSIVYAVEEQKVNGKTYKTRFYFLVEDGLGRSGAVSINDCPQWHQRRK